MCNCLLLHISCKFYSSYYIHQPFWVLVTVTTTFVRASSVWLYARFYRFFQRLESCRPSSCLSLWKHQHIWPAFSNECLFPLLFGKWCSDITKEKGFLTAATSNTERVGQRDIVRRAPHVRFSAFTSAEGDWGSDDVTDTDAFQRGPIKSTQGQVQFILEGTSFYQAQWAVF